MATKKRATKQQREEQQKAELRKRLVDMANGAGFALCGGR